MSSTQFSDSLTSDSLVIHLARLIQRDSTLNTVCQDTVESIHHSRDDVQSIGDTRCGTYLYVLRCTSVFPKSEFHPSESSGESRWLCFQPTVLEKDGMGKEKKARSLSASAIAPLFQAIERNAELEKTLASIPFLQLSSEEAIASYPDVLQPVLGECGRRSAGLAWDLFPIGEDERIVGMLATSRAADTPLPKSLKTTIEQAMVLVAIAIQNANLKHRLNDSQHAWRDLKDLARNRPSDKAGEESERKFVDQPVVEKSMALRSQTEEPDNVIDNIDNQNIYSIIRSLSAYELPAAQHTTVPWFYALLSATEFILWEEDLDSVFTYLSPQVFSVLGYAPEEMIGRKPTDFMTDDEAKRVARVIEETNSHPRPYIRFENTLIHRDGYPVTLETSALPVFDAAGNLRGYRGIDVDVSDRKYVETRLHQREQQLRLNFICQFYNISQHRQFEDQLKRQAQQERVARLVLQRIRQSLDISSVLSTAVRELRELLDVDRVILYQFRPDGSGVINHESVSASQWSVLHQVIHDPCFNGNTAQLYLQGKTSAIADVHTAELVLCYRKLLEQFNVRALLVVPIMKNVQVPVTGPILWGLVIAHHCSGPRDWNPSEIELMSQISDELAIAIQQAELYSQLLDLNESLESQVEQRTQQISELLNFEALLRQITTNIRESLDEDQIIAAAVEALKTTLGGIRCNYAVYNEAEGMSVICYETTDEPPFLQGQVSALADYDDLMPQLKAGECLQFCEPHPRSSIPTWPTSAILACPIRDNQSILGDLWLFRRADQHFSVLEMQLAKQVADQCAIAIRQSRLFRAAQTQVEELQKLNILKDDFLSTVSHELRTPMASIKVAVDLLEVSLIQRFETQSETQPSLPLTPLNSPKSDSLPSDSKTPFSKTLELDTAPDLTRPVSIETRIQQYLSILKHECKREINLIDDLLDLSRLDAGTEPLFLSQLNLQDWIPHVISLFDEGLEQRQQSLTLDLPPDLPALTTDFAYFERVLNELLQNAFKYTPAQEAIHVQVRLMPASQTLSGTAQPARFQLQVSNSGVEISPEERDRIFDKFYRIPNSDPWKNPGIGLGLALVRKLVEILQGTIAVSTTPGWTHFTVEIPSLSQSAPESESL